MKAIDLCDILKRRYKKGEFQCNMDSDICGNKPCDLCTVEKFENEIRADERERTVKEIAKASSSKVLNENIDYCMQTISLCEMTTERRKELCETLLSQRAMLTEFEKQIKEKTIDKLVNCLCQYNLGTFALTNEQNESIWRDIRDIAEEMKGDADNVRYWRV